MPRKSPPPKLPPLAPIRPLSPVSPLRTTYRTSPVSPLTPSPPLFRSVDFRSSEPNLVPEAPLKAEHLPIPPVRPERPQSQTSHSSINALPQRLEWSDLALEAQIARISNESKARRDFYILLALVFALGMIFLIVWLSVSNAGH